MEVCFRTALPSFLIPERRVAALLDMACAGASLGARPGGPLAWGGPSETCSGRTLRAVLCVLDGASGVHVLHVVFRPGPPGAQ